MKLDFFKRLDRYGDSAGLTIGGSETHQTFLGAWFSLLSLLTLILASIFFLIQFLDTNTPSVVQTTQVTGTSPEMDLYTSQFAPGFIVLEQEAPVNSLEIGKYFTFLSVKTKQTLGFKEDGSANRLQEFSTIDMVPCSWLPLATFDQLYGYSKSKKYTYDFLLKYGVCINPKSKEFLTIQGKPTDEVSSTLNWNLYPCDSNSYECKSSSTMQSVSVIIVMPEFGLDLTNKQQPAVAWPLTSPEVPVILSGIQRTFIDLKKNRIEDYGGFSGEELKTTEFLDVGAQRSSIGVRDQLQTSCKLPESLQTCTPFFEFSISSGTMFVDIQRNYKTIVDTLSSIGGIKEIIFMLFGFVYALFKGNSQQKYLRQQIFGGDEDTEEILQAIIGQPKPTTGSSEKSGEMHRRVSNDVAKIADLAISECLDIVTIVKELNKVKVLFALLFQDNPQNLQSLLFLTLTKQVQQRDTLEAFDPEPKSIQATVRTWTSSPQGSGDQAGDPINTSHKKPSEGRDKLDSQISEANSGGGSWPQRSRPRRAQFLLTDQLKSLYMGYLEAASSVWNQYEVNAEPGTQPLQKSASISTTRVKLEPQRFKNYTA